jgi:protein-arginine kinase activator protein McsA
MEEEVKKEEPEQKQEEIPEKPLDKMTATELREFVLSKNLEGVTGVHAMKKEELLKAVKEAMGIKDEAPAKKGKGPDVKKELNVKELKEKIAQLKEQKKEILASKDKKKAGVLRRRINRLKKQTKRVAKA